MGNEDLSKYQFELSIREKRIGAVFKAMCIVASFVGVIFVQLATAGSANSTCILYSCLLGFLIPLLFCMLGYIIKDAECFKSDPHDLTVDLLKGAQCSYNNIFECVRFSGLCSIICLVISLLFFDNFYIDKSQFDIISAVIAISWIILVLGFYFYKHRHIVHKALFVFSSLVCICLFLSAYMF